MAVDPAELARTIEANPWWFLGTWFGDEPAIPKQREMLESLRDNDQLFVRACYDSTKSFTASAALFWFLMSHPNDSIVVTTAPTWSQVTDQIWREAGAFYARAKRKLGGRMLKTELELGPKWYAVGKSTDNPVNMQGYHASHILVILDEADGIPKEIWDAIDGLLTSKGAKLLAIGNPLNPDSEFHKRSDAAAHKQGHKAMQIAASDVLPYSADKPYLLQQSWVDNKLVDWGGPESMMAQAKIYAEWPRVASDTLIPMPWLMRAKTRFVERGIRLYGADIARYGGNKTVRTLLEGNQLIFQRASQFEDTVQTTSRIIGDLEQFGPTMAAIDETGIGGGVLDQVRDYYRKRGAVRIPVVGVNNGAAPRDPTRFTNRGSEMWWTVRDGFERDQYGLACDDPDGVDDLINDLSRPTYSIQDRGSKITVHKFGRLRVEASMSIQQRSEESPDLGDSFVLAANAAEPFTSSGRKTIAVAKSYLPPSRPGMVSV